MDERTCLPLLHRWRRRTRLTQFTNKRTGERLGAWPHPWLICDRCGRGLYRWSWLRLLVHRAVAATDVGEWEGP